MIIPYEQTNLLSGGTNVGIAEIKNDSSGRGCEFHWHEALEFYYVVSGGVLLSAGGSENWLMPGDIGFVNSCIPHRGMRFLENTVHYIIQIDTDFFKQDTVISQSRGYDSLLTERLRFLPCFIHSKKQLSDIFSQLINENDEKKTGFELAVKSCIYNIFTLLIRMSETISESASSSPRSQYDRSSMEHIKNILRYLSTNYMNPEKVSLDGISRKFALSKPYICRIFRSHTNSTITEYLSDIRSHNAAVMIQSGIPLQEACTKVGISDYNYFSRMMKKSTGHSPIYFRGTSKKPQK